MLAPYTPSVAEVEAMFSKEELLKFEYLLNQKWAVTRMVQSYDSDDKMAYIHGFDAGIDLLCSKAKLSNPAIAESVRELAGKNGRGNRKDAALEERQEKTDQRCNGFVR